MKNFLKFMLASLAIFASSLGAQTGGTDSAKNATQAQTLVFQKSSTWSKIKNSTKLKAGGLMVGSIALATYLMVTGHNQEGQTSLVSPRYTSALAPIGFLYMLGIWLKGQEEEPLDPQQKSFWDPFIPSYTMMAVCSWISATSLSGGWLIGLANMEKPNKPKKEKKIELPETRFKDIVPTPAPEILEIPDHIKRFEELKRKGIKPSRGILLVGPPGTGKTLTARAIAGESGIPIIATAGSKFHDKYVGGGPEKVDRICEEGRRLAKLTPAGKAIIFIDEIDAVGFSRDADHHEAYIHTLEALLHQMDGFKEDDSLIFIAATNRPQVIDDALKRPGRFDNIIHCKLPNLDERIALMKHYLAKVNVGDISKFNFRDSMKQTEGWSGAELEAVVNQANRIADREKIDAIDTKCLLAGLYAVTRNKANGAGYR